MKLPKAKLENIVVQNLRAETLIYNLTTNQAFCLNDTSAKVFNACDGKTTLDELKNNHQLTNEIIYLALDGLRKENLIKEDYVSPFDGLSRREVIKKVGLASAVALPVVASLVAPTATHAASNCSTTPRATNCPVGTPTQTTNAGGVTCTSFNTNNICNAFYGSQCSSGRATTDSCTNTTPNQIDYTCKCAP